MKTVNCLGYGMGDPRSQGKIPVNGKKFISSEKRSDSLWSPNSLQFHARGIPSTKCI
jgi:hypothetical protein